ncbi:MAG TPA: phosphatidylserine/phosphatidylglycerophosphate/cardiolipin synthase family protein, partial [Nocardioidaceae bacterium]|nr:phosphatidylserine/phosphatidylglycerophosphate/cardiolipin synthase family protein [Nocardioidaceae bacterium]
MSTLPARTRLRHALRRTLLRIFGLQVLVAVILTLVDSYRRRGKKPKPFPITPPNQVDVGDG